MAGNVLDEVRRRVQHHTLGRRRRQHDPLCRIRRTLLTGRERLTDRQRARLATYLPVGDPDSAVELAYEIYKAARGIFHALANVKGRRTG